MHLQGLDAQLKICSVVQLIGGNNKEWMPDEVKRIVKKLKMTEAYRCGMQVDTCNLRRTITHTRSAHTHVFKEPGSA